MIDCSWGIVISEKLLIIFFSDATFGWLSYFLFPFCLLFFSPIISHQSVLRYFSISEVDSQTRFRVIPEGFIIYQYHLLLMRCHHKIFLHLLNRYYGSFPHRNTYAAAWREIFLDDFLTPFARMKTILSSVQFTFASIGATVQRDILLVYSVLDPEDNFMES